MAQGFKKMEIHFLEGFTASTDFLWQDENTSYQICLTDPIHMILAEEPDLYTHVPRGVGIVGELEVFLRGLCKQFHWLSDWCRGDTHKQN